MRYFLISFNLKNIASVGNILIEYEFFPSKTKINNAVHEQTGKYGDVIVQNIFEFKTKKDFEDFDF